MASDREPFVYHFEQILLCFNTHMCCVRKREVKQRDADDAASPKQFRIKISSSCSSPGNDADETVGGEGVDADWNRPN